MAYQSFEDLQVWQRSVALASEIVKTFYSKPYRGIHDQIQRSAISIPSNIAEGAERGGAKEFSQFLRYSQGSTGELKTQIIIAQKAEIIESDLAEKWLNESYEIAAMNRGLNRSISEDPSEY